MGVLKITLRPAGRSQGLCSCSLLVKLAGADKQNDPFDQAIGGEDLTNVDVEADDLIGGKYPGYGST